MNERFNEKKTCKIGICGHLIIHKPLLPIKYLLPVDTLHISCIIINQITDRYSLNP